MTRDPSALAREPFDVLIVGGGIHGLTAAYEGALAGLRVALVERRDFGAGASFNHLKTLHGGLQHLRHGGIRRMRAAVAERRAFVTLAPQFIATQAFVAPVSARGVPRPLALRAAMAAEALIGFDRNNGIQEWHHLPAGRMLSRDEIVTLVPETEALGTSGGAIWHDYRIDENDRLTLAFAMAAARQGAVLVNYVDAVEPLHTGSRIAGMRVRDDASGEMLDVRAAMTLNAAGGAAGRLMALFGARYPFPLLKGINLLTTRPAPPAAIVRRETTVQPLVALPWRGRLVLGTVYGHDVCGPDDALVTVHELDTVLRDVNATFPWLRLTPDDVGLVYRGTVPARVRPGRAAEVLEWTEIHDHRRDGIEGAISIVGASYTTARLTAERTMEAIGRALGRRLPKSLSAELPLLGPLATASESTTRPPRSRMTTAERVSRLYGATAARVLGLHAADRATEVPVAEGVDVTVAEVLEAVRHEMAVTLEDVIVRRTELGATGYPGDAVVTACGRIVQPELGWSDKRLADEVSAVRRFYEPAAAAAQSG